MHSWEAFLDLGRGAPAEACPPRPADLCTIMYTSGTTGDPKVWLAETPTFSFTGRITQPCLHE